MQLNTCNKHINNYFEAPLQVIPICWREKGRKQGGGSLLGTFTRAFTLLPCCRWPTQRKRAQNVGKY